MSVEANKTLTWGQQIGATVGGAVGGPIGALIGSILGQILESAVGDARAGIVGDYAVKAAELLTNSNFLQQRENEIYVNHDLENAGRDALQKAVCEIGGARCFPEQWREKKWQTPKEVVFVLDSYPTELAQEICGCLQGLYGRARKFLALDATLLNEPDFYLALQPEAAHDLQQRYWEVVLRQDLLLLERDLFARVPKFRVHLYRYLAERMFVHLGENLKENTAAWRALNRLLFKEIFAQLTTLQKSDEQLLAQIQETQRHLSAQIEALDLVQLASVISELGEQATKQEERIELLFARLLKTTTSVDTVDAKVKAVYQELLALKRIVHATYENTGSIRVTTDAIYVKLTEVQKDVEKIAEGQQRVSQQLPRQTRTALEIAALEHPPFPVNFIGRATELVQYKAQLQNTGLLVIAGMPGVGKSALAATVAQQVAPLDRIFWHTFRVGEDAYALVEHLARFLAKRMRPEIWYKLQETKRFSPREFFDALFTAMRYQNYLLCFDDFHQIEVTINAKSKESLAHFIAHCTQAIADQHLRVIATTRQTRSALTGSSQLTPLLGLNQNDATSLLQAAGLQLDDVAMAKLYQRTEGHAQLLRLAVPLLQAAADPLLLIDKLAETTNDVGHFLLSEIDRGLKPAEQKVMRGIAILLGYPATRAAIQATLGGTSVKRSLQYLMDCHLLQQSGSVAEPLYDQHTLVQHYYYDDIGNKQRCLLHRRAALYYEVSEVDLLKAILHFERANEFVRATQLTIAQTDLIIQRGQASLLQEVVDRLLIQTMTLQDEIALTLILGALWDALDDREKAQQTFDKALIAIAAMPSSATKRLLETRAYHGLGKLWELEKPPIALAWLQKGITILTTEPPLDSAVAKQELAALSIDLGNVELYLGHYDNASRVLNEGLNRLPSPMPQMEAIAYKALNTIALYQGDLAQAQDYAIKALEINRKLGADFETAHMLVNLSSVQYGRGDWSGAIVALTEARILAEQLNSAEVKAAAALNLGDIYSKMGDDEAAYAALQQALDLAKAYRLAVLEIFANFTLANQHIKLDRWAAARTALQLAEDRSTEIEHQSSQTVIASLRAELALGEQQANIAQAYAKQAITLAQATGETPDEGIAQRLLGQALLAQQQWAPAFAAFERSLVLLTDNDPYEVARTQVQLGLAHRLNQNLEQADILLQAARTTFQQLGARYDLAKLDQLAPVVSR